ncbi:MAG TPA: D-arabinono-1,4-lactone oxidase [Bryobacteraceae bacterium]|nr:D-arabinono-1,4-lactone oxidase [Bryobacteraceae bacterium]
MDKRQFLKTSGALVAGGMLSNVLGHDQESAPRKNWAGNYQYRAARLHTPQTVEELRQIVRNSNKAKPLGARHSFNSIADTRGEQISLKNFNQMSVDSQARSVTLGAGLKYGDLCPYIDSKGFAVHNLASLPHVSVIGAAATATHGSGIHNGNLATPISALEMVTADGDLVALSRERDGDRFHGAIVALGALGVVTKLTLDVQPRFDMRQVVYENLSFDHLQHHLDEIFSAGYSVSLFTDWQNHRATQVWIKSRVQPGRSRPVEPEFFGAKLATRKLHPLAGHSAENCTEQLGIPGPWYERLPHFRMNFTPSSGDELQSEYFVPRAKGYEAILAVERLRNEVTPHLFITELRTIEADDLWMSPCYQRASMTIHFTWKPEWNAVKELLPLIEEQLAPFDARPHWAKLFTMRPSRLQAQYQKLPDFRGLAKQYDPAGKFRNDYLSGTIL